MARNRFWTQGCPGASGKPDAGVTLGIPGGDSRGYQDGSGPNDETAGLGGKRPDFAVGGGGGGTIGGRKRQGSERRICGGYPGKAWRSRSFRSHGKAREGRTTGQLSRATGKLPTGKGPPRIGAYPVRTCLARGSDAAQSRGCSWA
jgi:hypothetical protein